MIFDTDVLIWVQRGNLRAAKVVDQARERFVSVQTYLELLQCAQDKRQIDIMKNYLKDFGFSILPLTENIGHRAIIYLEQFGLSHGLRAGDAIIAATASENNLPILSGNAKHFQAIKGLVFKRFRPD